MRSLRYLNTVLTIIAVLLTLNLWTQWTGGPGHTGGFATPAQAAGIADAGKQRKEIADLLKHLVRQSEQLTGLFKSGQARVRVAAAADE